VVVQAERLGTGHAVRAALPALDGVTGTVLVIYGDTPLLTAATLARLTTARAAPGVGAAVLGFRPADPTGYGRLVTDAEGRLARIVEHADADAPTRAIDLCNAGVMALDGRRLAGWLAALTPANAKGEFYLTDVVALARQDGATVLVVETDPVEAMGVNSRVELAAAEAAMQARLRQAAMEAGATLIDPATVWLAWDTRLGRDVTVGPSVVFGPGVVVEDGAEIRAFCHLESAHVGPGAVVGPFARLRPETVLEEHAHIGNFVEVKKSRVGRGAKANHLAYLGDATIGAGANIGAGTITCNYDGVVKSQTRIGAGVFIGSNSALVAPLAIGDRAFVAAGSIVTEDVPDDALAFGRARQATYPGRADSYRKRLKPPSGD
jgi:bifunctional UDP-N-acetylglucosamine pyrophosphorylase/glucosamine-1-phosphate N-acetyltransferase